MKLETILFILAVISLSSSAEKIKGRRSNLRIGQLLNRTDHENVDIKSIKNEKTIRMLKADPSKGRFFYKKQNTAPAAQPTIVVIPSPSSSGSSGSSSGSSGCCYGQTTSQVDYNYESTGTITISSAPAAKATNNDEDDWVDEEDDDQAPVGNRKQKNNLKLKKINGKKQNLKYVVPARYVHNFENNAPVSNSGNFKNGANKFIKLRLSDNANVKKKFENIPVRVLVQNQ